MGPTKVKKENSKLHRTSKLEQLSKQTDQWGVQLTEKLKEFKVWAQVKSPKNLQPALSYALDWLVPELLGTGFRMYEISDTQMKAVIPANRANLDSQHEIHQGLVTNALFEMNKSFLQRSMPDRFFHIVESELHLSKKTKWSQDLHLHLQTSQADLDDFFLILQKNKKAVIDIEVQIDSSEKQPTSFRTSEKAQLKLTLEIVHLIA